MKQLEIINSGRQAGYMSYAIFEELEVALNSNKKVVLISSDFPRIDETLDILDEYKNIRVLSADVVCNKFENAKVITKKEEQGLLNLYHMYDVSDKFLVLENSSQYGSVFDYVNEGIISFDEAIKMLISG
jgi:hypothetical protein